MTILDDEFIPYWQMLFGAEPPSSLAEVRYRLPGDRMGQEFFGVRDCQLAYERIRVLGPTTDVYVGVAPRKERRGSSDAIERLHVVWADCDTPESAKALNKFRPPPTMVVASGRGLHPYWSLREPVDPETAVQANRSITGALGADLASTDAARILRPPGTFNHKRGAPRPVEIKRRNNSTYGIDELLVGELPARQAKAPTTDPAAAASDDFLLTRAPAEYVELISGIKVTPGSKIRCPLPGHEDKTPSFHIYKTVKRGWRCYGCGRGGTIYTFAAAFAGLPLPLRGVDFLRVQEALLVTYESRAGLR